MLYISSFTNTTSKSLENLLRMMFTVREAVSEEEIEVEGDDCYVPLTCDLCKKTFTTPALWVQHIQQKHPSTALASGKRGDALDADNSTGFPPLHCEMCKKVFTVPADWVKHIQSHTEEQLTENNDKVAGRKFQCKVCSKVMYMT
ncbi:hypothetical protein J6590_022492 [Homalodisca vitripennis]|nr:hypothetical protein J6590_022492 [Homalodisca vitripennis]